MKFAASDMTLDGSWRVEASWRKDEGCDPRHHGGNSLLPHDFGEDEVLCRAVAADLNRKEAADEL